MPSATTSAPHRATRHHSTTWSPTRRAEPQRLRDKAARRRGVRMSSAADLDARRRRARHQARERVSGKSSTARASVTRAAGGVADLVGQRAGYLLENGDRVRPAGRASPSVQALQLRTRTARGFRIAKPTSLKRRLSPPAPRPADHWCERGSCGDRRRLKYDAITAARLGFSSDPSARGEQGTVRASATERQPHAYRRAPRRLVGRQRRTIARSAIPRRRVALRAGLWNAKDSPQLTDRGRRRGFASRKTGCAARATAPMPGATRRPDEPGEPGSARDRPRGRARARQLQHRHRRLGRAGTRQRRATAPSSSPPEQKMMPQLGRVPSARRRSRSEDEEKPIDIDCAGGRERAQSGGHRQKRHGTVASPTQELTRLASQKWMPELHTRPTSAR